VPRARAAIVFVLALVVAPLAGRFDYHGGGVGESAHAAVGMLAGLAAAFVVRWLAVRKLGGLNGDVLGAMAETAMTVTLLVLALGVPWWLQ
jgi:adenosylcobinamide-GDP ribazoletransferase